MMITGTEQSARKEKILVVAFELFCKYGIEKVTISAIAAAAGQSQNSVYRYFESKPNLALCVAAKWSKEYIKNLINSLQDEFCYDELSGREQINLLMPKFIEHYANHRNYLIFREDYRHYMSNCEKMHTFYELEMINPILKPIVATFVKGNLDGSITCSDPQTMGYTVWSLARGHMSNIILWDRTFSDDAVGKACMKLGVDFILSALSNM